MSRKTGLKYFSVAENIFPSEPVVNIFTQYHTIFKKEHKWRCSECLHETQVQSCIKLNAKAGNQFLSLAEMGIFPDVCFVRTGRDLILVCIVSGFSAISFKSGEIPELAWFDLGTAFTKLIEK
jgi:hypothetical protein